jgi:hypothetical protein
VANGKYIDGLMCVKQINGIILRGNIF